MQVFCSFLDRLHVLRFPDTSDQTCWLGKAWLSRGRTVAAAFRSSLIGTPYNGCRLERTCTLRSFESLETQAITLG